MKRIILLLFLCSLFYVSGSTAGSIPDSLTVTWMKGKRYLVHKVEKDDDWGSISRKYGISQDALISENKDIRELKVNQFVFVPAMEKKTIQPNTKVRSIAGGKLVSSETGEDNRVHIVRQGENLYRISKMYNKSVNELMRLNNLSSNAVAVGQKLIVGSDDVTVAVAVVEEPVVIRKEEPKPVTPEIVEKKEMINKINESEEQASDSVFQTLISDSVLRNAQNPFEGIKATHEVEDVKKVSGGKKVSQIRETGVATFIMDEDLDQKKFYALHRAAPIGTIVKVSNIMTNQSVFVKVVGRLPDTGDNNNLIIKLSESAAREILTRDPFFRVVLTYGQIQ